MNTGDWFGTYSEECCTERKVACWLNVRPVVWAISSATMITIAMKKKLPPPTPPITCVP